MFSYVIVSSQMKAYLPSLTGTWRMAPLIVLITIRFTRTGTLPYRRPRTILHASPQDPHSEASCEVRVVGAVPTRNTRGGTNPD
jgi:hypothetical protein